MSCAHRNLHSGRFHDPHENPWTRCLDCGAVLSLMTVMMTGEQTAAVVARLDADASYHVPEWVGGVRPGRAS